MSLHPSTTVPGPSKRLARSACLLFLLVACAEPRKAKKELPIEATASRVDVFLRPAGSESEIVVMEVAGVRLRSVEGEEQQLDLLRTSVASNGARAGTLAGGVVDPSRFETLILSVSSVYLEAAGVRVPLTLLAPDSAGPTPEIVTPQGSVDYEIAVQLDVRFREAASLFLNWQVDASVLDRSGFRPVFTAAIEVPRPALGSLYVTDAASGSVFTVDRGTQAVTATNKVGAGPAGVAVSPNRLQLFVANQQDGSLSILDIRQGQATSTIPIRLSAGTCDVAVADPPDIVATANRGLDSVSFFDVRRSTKVVDVQVGRAPSRLVAAPFMRRLFVLNSQSDTISVLDVNSFAVIGEITVESSPTDLSIDRREGEIFVGHRTAQDLLVIDAANLVVVDSVFVGGRVTAVLADRRRDRVYVARTSPTEILVVERRVRAVVRRIPISGVVQALAQPVEGPFIYGAAPELGGLVVVNVISGQEEPLLPCGTSPSDVAVPD